MYSWHLRFEISSSEKHCPSQKYRVGIWGRATNIAVICHFVNTNEFINRVKWRIEAADYFLLI